MDRLPGSGVHIYCLRGLVAGQWVSIKPVSENQLFVYTASMVSEM